MALMIISNGPKDIHIEQPMRYRRNDVVSHSKPHLTLLLVGVGPIHVWDPLLVRGHWRIAINIQILSRKSFSRYKE